MVKVKEIWKTNENFVKYEVSNLGRVRNKKSGRILIPGKDKEGYNHYRLSNNYNVITLIKAHRLVATTFIENQFNKEMVDHINSDKTDNRVCNLRWCSAVENQNFNNARKSREKLGLRFYYNVTDLLTGYMMERLDQKQCIEYFGIFGPSTIAKRKNNITFGRYMVEYSK